jgi:hypothetical protein
MVAEPLRGNDGHALSAKGVAIWHAKRDKTCPMNI